MMLSALLLMDGNLFKMKQLHFSVPIVRTCFLIEYEHVQLLESIVKVNARYRCARKLLGKCSLIVMPVVSGQ